MVAPAGNGVNKSGRVKRADVVGVREVDASVIRLAPAFIEDDL